jgi:hypothetical protein
MTPKEEISQLIDKYDVACYDYASLKRMQILAVLLFFIGGFILFLILNNKKRKLNVQRQEVMQKLDSLTQDLSTDDYLELRQRIIRIGR